MRALMVRRRLSENVSLDPKGRQRKFLRDCTVEDLDLVINLLWTTSARTAASARERERVRDALKADGKAKVVSDLPIDILAPILLREAAA